MIILITGSRDISNDSKVQEILKKEISKGDVVIHGGARGVDSIAEVHCVTNNIKTIPIRPVKYQPAIYYLHRDAEMVGMLNMARMIGRKVKVLALWNGKSTGTIFTANYARDRHIIVKEYRV